MVHGRYPFYHKIAGYLLVLILLGSTNHLRAKPVSIPASILQILQPGDIIIRKGGGPLSYQLMHVSGENYSHCGMIVRHEGSLKIVQAAAKSDETDIDGVQVSEIADFVKYTVDSTLFICRPIIDSSLNEILADRGNFYAKKGVPFDHRFSLTDSERFYCLELLLHIFQDVYGDPVLDIRKQHQTYVPLFSSFFDSRRFRPIYALKN